MSDSGPLQFAFRSLWRRPGLALAETAWRWLYLLTAAALVVFGLREVLHAAQVTPAELAISGLYRRYVVASTLAQNAGLFVRAALTLTSALALLWMGMACLSRGAILTALAGAESPPSRDFRLSWPGMAGVYLLRALTALAAVVACMGAFLISSSAIPASGQDEAAAVVALCVAMVFLIWLAWMLLDWFLQLAPVFSVLEGCGSFRAIDSAVRLFRDLPAACLLVWACFAVCRLVLLLAIGTLALSLLVVTGPDWQAATFAAVLALLAYAALSSWLYIARFAAYIHLASRPVASASAPLGEAAPSFS